MTSIYANDPGLARLRPRTPEEQLASHRHDAALAVGLPPSAASRFVGTTREEVFADARAFVAEQDEHRAAVAARAEVDAEPASADDRLLAGLTRAPGAASTSPGTPNTATTSTASHVHGAAIADEHDGAPTVSDALRSLFR